MRARRSRYLLASAAVVAVAGCGTTVSGAAQTAELGGGLSVPSAAPGSAQSATAPGAIADASTGTGTATGTVTGSASNDGQAAGATQPLAPAQAVKAKLAPIRIGFTTAPDADAFFAAFGASFQSGDQNAEVKAAVAWVNAHGGLNGHPIQPMIEAVSATSQESYDSQYQKLCSKYAQDDKVVAATMIGIGSDENMDACMNNAHTLFVTGSNTLHDDYDYQRTPYVVSPAEVTSTVLARTMTNLVLSRKLVTRGGRLGLVNFDYGPWNRAVDSVVKPLLSAAGIQLTQYKIPPPSSTPDIGNSVAVDQSAELKMRSQGIDTVMFLCPGCLAFFAQAAKSQHYYPRYIFSSADGPSGGTDKEVFATSVGIGFEPVAQDLDVYAHPKSFTGNPTFDLCLQIEKAAGNVTGKGSLIASTDLCEDVMTIYAAVRANPVEPITSESLLKGVLSLGTRHRSAFSFGTDLEPDRHAGASAYRVMQWSDACGCLAYTGPLLAFPAR